LGLHVHGPEKYKDKERKMKISYSPEKSTIGFIAAYIIVFSLLFTLTIMRDQTDQFWILMS